jgi:RNA polymerase sigma-70 factor (sigma-E family)
MAGESERERAFGEFVAARYASLVRSAYLLTSDLGHAEDLVQTSLMRTYGAWRNLADPANAEAYTRMIMVRLASRWWKRRWRKESPAFPLPEPPVADSSADQTAELDLTDAVHRALRALPIAQRAVLVLRYYEDRTETEIAELLGCSVGTVKSRASRALAALRTAGLLPAEPSADSERARHG